MNDRELFLKKASDMGIEITPKKLEKCDLYAKNLRKWQKKINLIGPATVDFIYTRHILDALQVIKDVPRGTALDVGSGAGIPGLVWAIFRDQPVYLCERIGKKTAFLNSMVRELALQDNCFVLNKDVSSVNQSFDIITGRAVTSINDFLRLTHHCAHNNTLYILPKGVGYNEELETSSKKWLFELEMKDSAVTDNSKILFLSDVRHI